MYRHTPQSRSFGWSDIVVLAFLAGLIYGMVGFAQVWFHNQSFEVKIDLSPHALPRYTFFSFLRAFAGYLISLVFSLVYGYVAAKSLRMERILITFLDILQSIPVMGFLPGLVIGLVAVFPKSSIGLELACVLMIFSSQAWNMTFSMYATVKNVPSDLKEVSGVMGLNWFQRFKRVELPFSAIGLAWNSLMSMAGGWFFLTVCESFTLGNRNYHLPGIGSYMAEAIDQKDFKAMVYGVLAMWTLIIVVDFLIWRPVLAWVKKFQMDQIPDEIADLPFMTTLLRDSWFMRRMKLLTVRRKRKRTPVVPDASSSKTMSVLKKTVFFFPENKENAFDRVRKFGRALLPWVLKLYMPVTIVLCLWGGTRLWELVRTLNAENWRQIMGSVGLTAVRVLIATVLSSIWAIPVGILIALSPRATRIFQPIIQVVASFPAPMVYPILLSLMLSLGMGIHWGSSILMMMGVQWYILFNVIAGAMNITKELKDSMTLMEASTKSKWLRLYLPAAFPSLVTGWITAAGGAWNASIVAEYVHFGSDTLTAPGIGSLISRATAAADFPMLAGALTAMVATVVVVNQTFWRWLTDFAENRFRFER